MMDEKRIEEAMMRCIHFNGTGSWVCEAGVEYRQKFGNGLDCYTNLPCLKSWHNPEFPEKECERVTYPTREEIISQEEERDKARARLKRCIAAAHEDAKSKGIGRGSGGASHTICPNCGRQISYSVSGYNGHIHGRCETAGCASWME